MSQSRKVYMNVIGSLPVIPNGFSSVKGDPNYWADAVRDFWAETGLETDSIDLGIIVAWFDKCRDSKK